MHKEIYVVTEGQWSDYSIVGVYSTKSLAERAAKVFNGSVETYELDEYAAPLAQGKKVFFVRMHRDGEVIEAHPYNSDHLLNITDFDHWGNLITSVWAKDEQTAVKIANECRLQLVAMNRWGEEED
jgi:hypothetical protein